MGHGCGCLIAHSIAEKISIGVFTMSVTSRNPLLETTNTEEAFTKTSLLCSYLSGSKPAREEYVSKKRNVSNSLISSDSVHHSIFLESGRERRQCLLQYLSNVLPEGQAVIYVNSIPGAEALMNFLTKHGFQVKAVVRIC